MFCQNDRYSFDTALISAVLVPLASVCYRLIIFCGDVPMLTIPSRAPFGVDALALFALFILPFLAISLSAVRWGRAFRFHKFMQTTLGLALISALLVFEWQIRLEGWRLYAADSPYYDTWVTPALVLHLFCAAPTFGLWMIVLTGAWKKFPVPAKPGEYSMIHKKLGRIAAGSMVGTAASGWLFYWLAFVC